MAADLSHLVHAIGLPAVRALIECYGGISLAVPRRVDGSGWHTLADAIGAAAATALVKFAGGTELYIPKMDSQHRKSRNAAIRAQYDAGARVADLVRQHRLSERWVYAILGSSDEDDGKMGLF